jgi:hypothetical protein
VARLPHADRTLPTLMRLGPLILSRQVALEPRTLSLSDRTLVVSGVDDSDAMDGPWVLDMARAATPSLHVPVTRM